MSVIRERSPGSVWLNEGRGYAISRIVADVIALVLANEIALSTTATDRTTTVYVFPVLVVVLLALRHLYDPRRARSRLDGGATIIGAAALAAILTAGVVALFAPPSTDVAAEFELHQAAFATLLIMAERLALAGLRSHARVTRRSYRRALIVGTGGVGALLERRLREMPDLGVVPVGYLDDAPRPDGAARRSAPILGRVGELAEVLETQGAELVIIAFTTSADASLRRLVRQCEDHDVDVAIVPRLFDETTNRIVLDHVGGIPLFELRQVDPRGWQFMVKHGLDRAAAVVLRTLAAPLLAACAIAVRLSSPGPILFRQDRVGRDGRRFAMLKFRSMRPATPEEEQAAAVAAGGDRAPGGVEGVNRRTGVGRLLRASSLDELPQLVNVLRGEMSLVGPRPERPDLAENFAVHLDRYNERHRVKSGITGWAQVNGLRGKTSLSDRIEWDNWYIQNWSLWLDVKILLLTFGAVLRGGE